MTPHHRDAPPPGELPAQPGEGFHTPASRTKTPPIRTASVLAMLTAAGVFGAVAALFAAPIPEANADALNLALGALLSAYAGVIGFYFGSSKGARDLVETNTALAAKLPEARP